MLAIRLLGSPQILSDQKPLNLSRRKSRALVYYLAAHDRAITRDQLLAVFWPDLDRAAAQQTLRTTLHGLRKALGSAVSVDDDTLQLAPEVEVDSRAFEMLLASAHSDPAGIRAALELYRGDFLEGFSLPDSAAFDDWAAAECERLRRLAVRGLTALAGGYEAQGEYLEALAAVDRALSFDQLQEDLQRDALRLHYLAGDRAGAVRRYAHLRQLLDEEMGVLPMAETRALYDSILTDNLVAAPRANPRLGQRDSGAASAASDEAPAPTTQVPFAGREAELQILLALSPATPEAALSGRKLVLIEGEPGIGKSRLVEEFLARSNTVPLSGAAHELEQVLPYQPLIEALRCLLAYPAWPALHAALQAQLAPVWLAEVTRLLPELQPGLAPAAGGPDESRLWEGVHQFLMAAASQHPITFFVDDLQWADASTLALLNYLSRRARVDGAAILYLAAARPAEGGSALATFLQTLTREERLTRLTLSRLDPEAVAALAQQWAARRGAPADEAEALAGWLLPASEGNPFVLVELLRYACDQGLLRAGGHLDLSALGGSPVVPQTVYSLIQSRLARLSEPARRMLDAAVAAGREFEFEVVYRAAGLSEGAGLDALDELRHAGLIHEDLTPPAPFPKGKGEPGREGRTPASFNQTEGEPVREGNASAPVEGLKEKLRPTADSGPAPMARYAFDHSLTMEVAYREVGEPRHRLLHRRVAEALEQVYGRQRVDEIAGVLASHFAEGNQPQRAAPYAYRAGQMAAQLAAWAEAVAFFEQALQAENDPARRQASAAALGDAHFAAGHMAQASEAYRLALDLALEIEEEGPIASAQLALARAQLPQARYAEAKRLARQVREMAGEPEIAAAAEFMLGTAYSLEGADLVSATNHLRAAENLLRPAEGQPTRPASRGESGSHGRLPQIRFELGSVAAQQGDLAGAVKLYHEALEIADQEDALPYRILARNNLAYHMHLLAPGDPAAQAYADAGLGLAREHGQLTLMTYLFSTLGEIALGRGDLETAESRFKEGLALAERLPMPERVAGLTANLGLVALARGETALALYRLSAAMAQADALGTRHLAAQIRLWLAPLLPVAEGRARVAEVRSFAESAGRARLLAEANALDRQMADGQPGR